MDRIAEIRQEIEAELALKLPQLDNPSKTAEYKQWIDIAATIQATAETIIAIDKRRIQAIVDNNHIGTGAWYVEMAKQFQWSESRRYSLVVDENTGEIGYNVVNPADRIITQAAYTEGEGKVALKIATGEAGSLHPITPEQLIDFTSYIESIKIAGIKAEIVNQPADLIRLKATVYYDKMYSVNALKASVIDSLNRYSTELNFNGVVLRNAVIDAIQRVAGVADVEITELQGAQGEIVTDITRSYTTYAGYFNFENNEDYPELTIVPNG